MRVNRHLGSNSDPQRWLISYADYITLLLALFVLLFALAINDKQSLQQSLSALARIASNPSAVVPTPTLLASAAREDALWQPLIDELSQQLALTDEQLNPQQDGIVIDIGQRIPFAQGSATLQQQPLQQLQLLAQILCKYDNFIQVRGYADDKFIADELFTSPWHLAGERAITVSQALINAGVASGRITVLALPMEMYSGSGVQLAISQRHYQQQVPTLAPTLLPSAQSAVRYPVTDSREIKEIYTEDGRLIITTRQDVAP